LQHFRKPEVGVQQPWNRVDFEYRRASEIPPAKESLLIFTT
jgi:hypothetical protein